MKSPIVILGFGRSGTTWVSDIVSKIYGGLILFEPFHPSVTDRSKQFSYLTITDDENSAILKEYFENLLNKKHRKNWLLRNHIPTRIEDADPEFINLIWKECSIVGFKEIRSNFIIPWLKDNLNAKIIFIIRNPLAVVSSIKNRLNFWEFGWQETFQIFLEKTIYNDYYKKHKISSCIDILKRFKSDIEKVGFMWAITHAIVLPELKKQNIPIFYYEDFYKNPFSTVRTLFRYLGEDQIGMHPSYLFTPSMTTLKTIHGLKNMDQKLNFKNLSFFWEETLSRKEVDLVLDIVSLFGINIYNND
jgi:hypothetical protein